MSRFAWTKKRSIITIVLITILAVSSFGFWQANNNVQAAILDPHPGLVGWWSFNEGTGTIANDSSGSNTGTLYGAAWVDGKYGKAVSFAGTNDYVTVPFQPNFREALTCSMWIKRTTGFNQPTDVMLLSPPSGWYFYDAWSSGRIQGDVFIDSVRKAPLNVEVPFDGNWYQIVYTYDSATHVACMYKNGVLSATITLTGLSNYLIDAATGSLTDFGKNSVNRGISLDEIRVYNRALTQAEIQADFNGGPDSAANVLAKVPQGTTQVITTLSWEGTGNIGITIRSPAQDYFENTLPVYQKSSYSTSNGITNLLNIKRVSISVTALSSDQNWNMILALDKVDDYQITVEVQK